MCRTSNESSSQGLSYGEVGYPRQPAGFCPEPLFCFPNYSNYRLIN